MKKYRSFTLLEVLLGVVIIVMIMGTVYTFYSSSVRQSKEGKQIIEDAQLARVVLLKIASELRGVTSSGSRFTSVLTGDEENIRFVTTAVPSRLVFFPQSVTDKGRPIEHDLHLVEYMMGRSEDDKNVILGLQRDELRCMLSPIVEKKSAEDLTPEEIQEELEDENKFSVDIGGDSNDALEEQPLIKQMLISDRIRYLRFDYYDGKQWLNSWNPVRLDAIPRAVKITIGFREMDPEEYEAERVLNPEDRDWRFDQYSLLVSLILADDLKSEYAEQIEEDTE